MNKPIPETPFEQVVMAIKLTLTAPTLLLAEQSAEIGARIASAQRFSDLEMDQAKALALAECLIERGNK